MTTEEQEPEAPITFWERLIGRAYRKDYFKAVRALQTAQNELDGQQEVIRSMRTLETTHRARIEELEDRVTDEVESRRHLIAERTEINVALGRVSTLENLVGVNPTAMLVDGLARDHEELEERIEAVLDTILTRRNIDHLGEDTEEYATLNRIAGLLQGQIPRVPDTIEEIDPDGGDLGSSTSGVG